MKYIFTLLAALLVVGSLAVLPIYAEEGDGGDEYGEPPAVENETMILAEEGGDGGGEYSEPPTMENGIVTLAEEADGGGDMHGEPSPEEARDVVLV